MICYECDYKIKRDFANFCDQCGADLNEMNKPKVKNQDTQKNIISLDLEMERVTDLFLLWNFNIVASFIFYIIHLKTDHFGFLVLIILFMLILSWILLLMKLREIAVLRHDSMKKLMLINFGLPFLGTFYYYLKMTQKLKIDHKKREFLSPFFLLALKNYLASGAPPNS